MAAAAHVYDWARGRGYWLAYASDAAPTHLLLDGGKLRVPDESHASFLNAYASSVVRFPDRRPCIVELRTRVFKFFVDFDTRFESLAAAEAARDLAEPMLGVLRRVCASVAACGAEAEVDPGEALVCSGREVGEDNKLGFHVVWPDLLVTAPTARRIRDRLVADLASTPPAELGIQGTWESVADASVYKSNGLRLPWSAKGRATDRFYELRGRVRASGELVACSVTTVSALRDAVHALSIRTFNKDPTLALGGAEDDEASTDEGRAWTAKSLAAYSDLLPKVAAALPVQFVGSKFTGAMVADHCVMLRSTARYCFNLGRAHRTNNVYFMLTRRGVCQRCYCRCETAEGRKYGMCKDFSSDVWPVPDEVTAAFFGDDSTASSGGGGAGGSQGRALADVRVMPSRTGKSHLSFDKLLARSRPAAAKTPARKKARGAGG